MRDRMPSNALYEQFNQDLCCYCLTETLASTTDALGVPWCKEHAYRGKFLTWGLAHDFPAMDRAAVCRWTGCGTLVHHRGTWQRRVPVDADCCHRGGI